MAPVFERCVADGVHRLAHAAVNLYLVEDDTGITVVDTGLPATFRHLERALAQLGYSHRDVRAIVLTHAHFDHVGSARRARKRWRMPVGVHAADRHLAAHPYRYDHERSRLRYPLRYPGSIQYQAKMAAAGALVVRGIADTASYGTGAQTVLPGHGEPWLAGVAAAAEAALRAGPS